HADEPVAVEQGMRGEAPVLHRRLVFLAQVLAPDHLALARLQAEQIAHGAERVDALVAHEGRGPRSGGITDLIGAIVFVLPENLPALFIEAEDALLALRELLALGRGAGAIGDIDASARDGGPRIAGPDGSPPAPDRAAVGEFVEDSALAPDAVTLGAEPLRPVVSPRRRGQHDAYEADACRFPRRNHEIPRPFFKPHARRS